MSSHIDKLERKGAELRKLTKVGYTLSLENTQNDPFLTGSKLNVK